MITKAMKIAYDMSYQDWVPDESIAYAPYAQDRLSSRIYGMIGADTSGKSYVHFRGFGPEYKQLIKKVSKNKEIENIGTDIIIYPSDGYALGLLKETAIEGRKLGFQYGAGVNLGAINRAIDPFVDGTLLGRVEKKMDKKDKIANKLATHIRIAQKLILGTNAEQEVEKVLKVVLPGSEFANKTHAVGGYVRDELLAKMNPESGIEAKDLDIVVEMDGGAKKITKFLHETLKNSKGKPTTHRPHELGAGYPIWQLSFFTDENGDTLVGDTTFKTSGAVIEFADTQKEAFPDPDSRQRVTNYGTLEEDVERRDFTVNMLLKDMTTGEIKDLTGTSKEDLKKGVLKGHPNVDLNKIFADDPLRMIRLIRFKVKYDWDVPNDVKDIVKKNAHRLNIVSAERMRDELAKVMSYGKLADAIGLMKSLGFDKVETEKGGEINPVSYMLDKFKALEMRHESSHHIDTEDKKDDKIIDHTMNVLRESKSKVEAQLAALLHDIGKPETRNVDELTGKLNFRKHEEAGLAIAEDILRRFKFKKETIDKVLRLIKSHMRPHNLDNASDKALRKFIREMGDDLDDVLDLAKADSEGKNPSTPYIDKLRSRIDVLQSFEVKPKTKPVLNGKEVMDILNLKSGPQVGKANAFILDLQDENPSLTKEEAKQAILKEFK